MIKNWQSGIQMSFGDRVKQRRKALKLTQKALADKVGISRSAVNSWEMGDHIPGGKPAQLLPSALSCSWDWLTTGRGHPDTSAGALGPSGSYESSEARSIDLVLKSRVISYVSGEPVKTDNLPAEYNSIVTLLEGSQSTFAFREDSPGMTPRIMPGELVLIDPDARRPHSGEWAFDIGGEVTVGVVNKTPGGLMLSFYNTAPGWDAVQVSEDQLIGRVVASLPSK